MLFPQPKEGWVLVVWGLGVVFYFVLFCFVFHFMNIFQGIRGREEERWRWFVVWVIFLTAKCQHAMPDAQDG